MSDFPPARRQAACLLVRRTLMYASASALAFLDLTKTCSFQENNNGAF